MDNIISIELFKQVHKFKTDLDQDISIDAVKTLKTTVSRLEAEAALGASSVQERQIMLMIAALDIACDNIRLKKKYNELLEKMQQASNNLLEKLSIND